MSPNELWMLFRAAGARLTGNARLAYLGRLRAAADPEATRDILVELLAEATAGGPLPGMADAGDISRLWRVVGDDWRHVRSEALAGLVDQSDGPHVCDCGCVPPHSDAPQCARNRESTRLYMRRVNGFDQRGA